VSRPVAAIVVGSIGLISFSVFLLLAASGEQAVEVPESELSAARLEYEREHAPPRSPAAGASATGLRDRAPVLGAAARSEPRPASATRAEEQIDELEAVFGETPELPQGADFFAKRKYVRRIYDRQRYPDALELGKVLLEERPRDVYLLRVMVSAACFTGEVATARTHWERLRDRGITARRDLLQRCHEFGIDLNDG
jgi:hypothetical protein